MPHVCPWWGGCFIDNLPVAEPKIHVPGKMFDQEVATAIEVGLRSIEEPRVHGCRAVVLALRKLEWGTYSYGLDSPWSPPGQPRQKERSARSEPACE